MPLFLCSQSLLLQTGAPIARRINYVEKNLTINIKKLLTSLKHRVIITTRNSREVINMGFLQKLTNEPFARSAAKTMKFVCYLVMILYALCIVLSLAGRQSFFLHTKSGTFERAIYAEDDHAAHSRTLTVQMYDDVHVWTNDKDEIDLTIQIGLSLMFAFNMVPMIFAFWFLSRVFSNVQNGEIFTEQNAAYLLYYGLLQFFVAVIVPFIKLLICWLVSLVSDCQMSISTGQGMLSALFPSIAFVVAAYIIHYGVSLQDEVDHTL